MMHALTNLLHSSLSQTLVLTSFLMAFASFSLNSAHAQNNSQALSPSELQRINNQPLAPAVSASQATSAPKSRKPSFQHKESTGTEITEYKDTNAPTQVDVKTRYTNYEMAPPATVMPGVPKETDLISVPSIRVPF
ncbi:hypothetical protein CL55_00017070 [Polynucleobacter duraquae]|uniref:Transmembrane protein n=1 Tax=Polynucleobacter duraquae TaxID=1835254 RepID=A0A0E3ZNA4_9BURK|nr:hypothetical protein [Polynucleobacter duraquae]AKD26040.1 hypothetical protein CL55_00017070 [Polynucleobacter duraquae]